MSTVTLRIASATALVLGVLAALPAQAGKDLDAIKARGALVCGVNTGLAGFSAADSQGKWTGLDVDYCRALAAAILGDAEQGEVLPLTAQQRFTALQSGEVDVLSRNTTWTLTRDASLGHALRRRHLLRRPGLHGARRACNMKSAKQLKGADRLRAVRHDHRAEPDRLLARQQPGHQAGGVREGGGRRPPPTSPAAARPTPPTPRAWPRSAARKRQKPGRPRDPARADLEGAAGPDGAPRRRRMVRDREVGDLRR